MHLPGTSLTRCSLKHPEQCRWFQGLPVIAYLQVSITARKSLPIVSVSTIPSFKSHHWTFHALPERDKSREVRGGSSQQWLPVGRIRPLPIQLHGVPTEHFVSISSTEKPLIRGTHWSSVSLSSWTIKESSLIETGPNTSTASYPVYPPWRVPWVLAKETGCLNGRGNQGMKMKRTLDMIGTNTHGPSTCVGEKFIKPPDSTWQTYGDNSTREVSLEYFSNKFWAAFFLFRPP